MGDLVRVIEAEHIDKLLSELNKMYESGWRIAGTIQEHGYTKVILHKENP